VNGAITNLTELHFRRKTVTRAFMNLNLTYDPIGSSLATYLKWGQDLGFFAADLRTNSLYDLAS